MRNGLTENDVAARVQRLEVLRRVRQTLMESGEMNLEPLEPEDAERIKQAARTAAGNELRVLFEQARSLMDEVLES
jgi:magnesium-transporting ATPase (P-type)